MFAGIGKVKMKYKPYNMKDVHDASNQNKFKKSNRVLPGETICSAASNDFPSIKELINKESLSVEIKSDNK